MTWVLACLLACGALRAEVAPGALTQTASPSPTVVETAQAQAVTLVAESSKEPGDHAHVFYMFSFSEWNVFNGKPLGYTPFELGYDFGKGFRIQSAVDLFYYTGPDVDLSSKDKEALGRRDYSYDMTVWRTTAVWRLDTGMRLRPLAGLAFVFSGGSRRLAPDFSGVNGKDVNADSPKIPAEGYVGLGTELGLEYLLSYDWTLHLSCRYDFTFKDLPSPIVPRLGLMVGF